MSEHPIQGLMSATMENLKQMVDVNTIIGDPVETPDGSVILTVSKVGFGFATGGSDFTMDSNQSGSSQAKQPFGGGSGGGVSITPIAFLIVGSHGVKMLHLDQGTHLLEKMLDTAPTLVEKIQNMLSKNGNQNQGKQNQDNQKQSRNRQQSGRGSYSQDYEN